MGHLSGSHPLEKGKLGNRIGIIFPHMCSIPFAHVCVWGGGGSWNLAEWEILRDVKRSFFCTKFFAALRFLALSSLYALLLQQEIV